MNKSLAEQLKSAVKSGKVRVKYPTGYKKWKAKFERFYNLTKDLDKTFDIMYGPGGGVNNYRGSLYRNSNVRADELAKYNKHTKRKKHPKSKKSGALGIFKNSKGGKNVTKKERK